MARKFDGEKATKLGTEKKPAVVNVQTEERLKEVASIFEENGWKYTIELEPKRAEKKAGRNEPCPCGSGKKYKKCCGK